MSDAEVIHPGDRATAIGVTLSRVAHLLWPVALTAAVFLAVGRYGFNPTDEGLIQAQALKILHGAIPHLDIVSPRPLGSAVLHTVDVILPTPLVETSRFLAFAEIMGYSLLLGTLTYRRQPLRWTITQCAGVAAVFLVNVHTFPATAWHTIDGILLASAGLVFLSRGLSRDRQPWIDAGMLSLGIAVVTKQSFAIAPVLGLVWVATATAANERTRVPRRVIRAACVAALPVALYGAVVALAGGGGEAWRQLTGGDSVVGEPLFTAFVDRDDARNLLGGLVVLGGLLAGVTVLDHLTRTATSVRGRSLAWIASVAARAAITALVVRVALHDDLGLLGVWGMTLLWFLVVVVVWQGIAHRRYDGRALLVAALGWMAMLSWGYAVPNLVAGSIALVIVHRAWQGATPPERLDVRITRVATVGLAAVLLILAGHTLRDARREHVYRDLASASLSADLGLIDDAFHGIRTNPTTARYLRQVKDCIARYPASRVAVLPDNAMLYAAFDLENPFPSEWMIDTELVAPDSVYNDVARQLSREGDFLVLFQTVRADSLYYQPLPEDVDRDAPAFGYTPLIAQIREQLDGRAIACGSFVGVYQPPRA